MCTWCRPRELISPVSFFTLLYQRILHENRVFLFLYIFPVAKHQLMGELTCVYKSQRHGLDLLRITSVTRHLLRWFGAKKLKLTGLLFGLHADLKCAEVCYKNMMPWTNNQDFAPFESELVFELFRRMSIKSGQTTPTRSWLPDSLIADYWVFIF